MEIITGKATRLSAIKNDQNREGEPDGFPLFVLHKEERGERVHFFVQVGRIFRNNREIFLRKEGDKGLHI